MPTRIETDVSVQRFGLVSDESGNRLLFPHALTHKLEGRSGTVSYGVDDCVLERLEGRLGTLLWSADSASFGKAWLRDDAGKFDIAVDRIEMPSGIQLTRGQSGVEIIAPQVSLSEMRLTVNGPFGRSDSDTPAPPKSDGAPTLKQDRLRFLDSLTGRIYLTVKVVLDLPVLGKRTLDQDLKVAIQEGQIDFRALENSLDWLEGRFIDIEADGDRLVLSFRVPIFGSTRELISWQLDSDASTVSSFGKVPVRSLADFRAKGASGGSKPDDKGKRKILQSLAIEGIDIAIGLLAPRSLEVGNGLIMFGGDDQPGMVDLKVAGSIRDVGPGKLTGAIGSIDTTIKDLRLGPMLLTADRLHFDGLEGLEVTFDGFRPVKITMVVSRVTATNLALRLGGDL